MVPHCDFLGLKHTYILENQVLILQASGRG